MSADPDGDSEMLSSSGSASLGTRTPTETRKPSFAGSELSPPGSQEASQHRATGPIIESPPGPEKGGKGPAAADGKVQSAQQKEQPGASWMNQRAQEEYNRALESVVDKDFSLKEFGDPFDERDMNDQVS